MLHMLAVPTRIWSPPQHKALLSTWRLPDDGQSRDPVFCGLELLQKNQWEGSYYRGDNSAVFPCLCITQHQTLVCNSMNNYSRRCMLENNGQE